MKFRVKEASKYKFYPQVKFGFWTKWEYIVTYNNFDPETYTFQPSAYKETLESALEAIEKYKDYLEKHPREYLIPIYHQVD